MIHGRNRLALMVAALSLTAGMAIPADTVVAEPRKPNPLPPPPPDNDPEEDAARLSARIAELEALIAPDMDHLSRVLSWVRGMPDVAEAAIRRIRRGWRLSEDGFWEPPQLQPLPSSPYPPDIGPFRTREEARRMRQAARNKARRGAP